MAGLAEQAQDVVALRRALERVCVDLGLEDACCPYYDRYYALKGYDPKAICTRGCRTEPSCMTDEPSGGWPSVRLLGVVHDWLNEQEGEGD